MRKRWAYAIQLVLSLVIINTLAVNCAGSPSTSAPGSVTAPSSKTTSAPPASTSPADISGRVIVAEKVKCATAIAVPPNEDTDVFWIADISIKNNAYRDSVKADFQMSYKGWAITANDKVYVPRACGFMGENSPIALAIGQTGKFMLHFSVPKNLQINDAQICYQGQKPYSYGKLTGGEKVVAFDWDSKKVLPNEKTSPTTSIPSNEYRETVKNGVYQSGIMKLSINGNYINVVTGLGNFSYKYRLLGNRKAEITYLGSNQRHWFGSSLVTTIEFYQIEGTGNLVIQGVECVKIE